MEEVINFIVFHGSIDTINEPPFLLGRAYRVCTQSCNEQFLKKQRVTRSAEPIPEE